MDRRGALLFEYNPLPMTAMTVAGLLLLIIVTVVALALPPELFGPLCFAPLGAAVLYGILQSPSPTRIFALGIEPSRPLWRRALRAPAYVPWQDVRNVYPAAYEISGAAMSPFASSAGTLVHTGLGLELADGRRIVVKFTPGSIRAFRGESPGFTYAMASVREAFEGLRRPLVSDVRPYSDGEVLEMHKEARRPLVGLAAIVYAFFLPPAILAAILYALAASGVRADLPLLLAAIVIALVPPIASMEYTIQKSRRRNWLLAELAKHEEAARART